MTTTAPIAPELGANTSAEERRAAARAIYTQQLAAGTVLTGEQLGRLVGRSGRWGRAVIASITHTGDDPDPAGRAEPVAIHADRPALAGTQTVAQDEGSAAGVPVAGRGSRPAATPHTHPGQAQPSEGRPDNGQPAGNGRPVAATAAPAATPGQPPAATSTDRQALTVPAGRARGSVVHAGSSVAMRQVTTLAVLTVALVAGLVSFEHQREVAILAGEGWRSWLIPLSVDGLIIAASMCLLTARRNQRPAGALAWTALLLGLGASLGANVIAADPALIDPDTLARIVAAWPPSPSASPSSYSSNRPTMTKVPG